jgi:hypothetical protein
MMISKLQFKIMIGGSQLERHYFVSSLKMYISASVSPQWQLCAT